MSRPEHSLTSVVAALFLLATPVLGDDVADQVSEFVESARQETREPVVLAAKVLEGAQAAGDDVALRLAFCEEAYRIGMATRKREGTATAADAARMHIEADENTRGEWYGKLVQALRLQLRQTGGIDKVDVRDRLHQAAKEEEVWKEIDKCRARLQRSREDRAARQGLIDLYVAELDRPEDALPLLDGECEESCRTCVPLAAKGVGDLDESESLTLGDWYFGLSQARRIAGKLCMLCRTKMYYQRYLELHSEDCGDVQRAQRNLRTLCDQQTSYGIYDLLWLVDLPRHVLVGRWERKGAALVASYDPEVHEGATGTPTVAVPVLPQGSYEVRAVVTMPSGKFRLVLPVGDTMVDVMAGWQYTGIGSIDGIDSGHEKNPTRVGTRSVENRNEPYTVRAVVLTRPGRLATVTVEVNGEEHVNWSGPVASLSTASRQTPRAVILWPVVSQVDPAVIHDLTLRMLSGTARRIGK